MNNKQEIEGGVKDIVIELSRALDGIEVDFDTQTLLSAIRKLRE